MFKKILTGLLVSVLIAPSVLAEAYTGTTTARSTLAIPAKASGIIEEMYVQPGSTADESSPVARLRTTKVFANQNGTVARIDAEKDKEVNGTVLELNPVSRYTVYCTSGEAYDSIASNLVHCGETLYLYCTSNGTHQGFGTVYSIDGETYMLEAAGGEFYIGETVYIYRDADHTYKHLVGIGTVVSSATEPYEAEGRIAEIHVSEGEYVERGELLYEIIEGDESTVLSPASGIITGCEAGEGDRIEDGDTIAAIAPWDEICISVQMSEEQAVGIHIGDQAAISYAGDPEERLIPGEVVEVSRLAQDGSYTVYIFPETPPDRLGLTVNVRIG